MRTINILTIDNFFHDHCSYCFIYPIIKNQRTFLDNGIKFKLFQRLKDGYEDCDVAIVDSRFYGNLVSTEMSVQLRKYKKQYNFKKIDKPDDIIHYYYQFCR